MRIYVQVKRVEVKKFPAFDPKTGMPDPSYFLQVVATDLDSDGDVVHQCSFDSGFGIEDLRQACKSKAPESDRDVLSGNVLAAAQQLEGNRYEFTITKKPRAKGSFVSYTVASLQPLQA